MKCIGLKLGLNLVWAAQDLSPKKILLTHMRDRGRFSFEISPKNNKTKKKIDDLSFEMPQLC